MIQVLTVVHECADFTRWKSAYDADAGNRRAAGLTELVLARNEGQRGLMALIFEMADAERARAMMSSAALQETMQKAGVIGKPEIHFRRGEFTAGQAGEFLTIDCRISSIEAFRRGFAMDKSDRASATLTDLGVLQDMNDPADLLVIFKVGDRARASAFLASPALAEHQVKNAGVVGPPQVRYWTSVRVS